MTQSDIHDIYIKAQNIIQTNHPEWLCTIENGKFIVQLNWMEGTYFKGFNITKAQKAYRHVITVSPQGKFTSYDAESSKEFSVGLDGIHYEASSFQGYSARSTTEIVIGKKSGEEKIKANVYSFNSDAFKKEIRNTFESLGISDGRSSISKFFDNVYAATATVFGGVCAILMGVGILVNRIAHNAGYFEFQENGIYKKIPYNDASFFTKWGMIIIPGGILALALAIVIFKYWYDHYVASME